MKITLILFATVLFLSCKKETSITQKQVDTDSISVSVNKQHSGIQRFQPSCGAGSYDHYWIKLPGTTIWLDLSWKYNGSYITDFTLRYGTSTSQMWLSNGAGTWSGDNLGQQMYGMVQISAPNGLKQVPYDWSWNFNPETCMLYWGRF